MKFLKKFNEMVDDIESNIPMDSVYSQTSVKQPFLKVNKGILYGTDWEKELPETMSINYHGEIHNFKKGNIMLLADLVEITYESYPENPWGKPDCLEFDMYFVKDNEINKQRIDIDITYGDLVACEFSIEAPNKINVIQHTTYNSKFDPSNTVFALTDKSLDEFIKFLNKFPKMEITRKDMRFLDQYDNWSE